MGSNQSLLVPIPHPKQGRGPIQTDSLGQLYSLVKAILFQLWIC